VTRVEITWNRRPSRPAAEALRRTVGGCLDRLEAGRCEVHLLLTGDETIRALNREYLGDDRPTDVLSFPDGDVLPNGRRLLGEIVVSLDTARRQAAEAGSDELQELEELVLHGTLHLLGYDHASDQGEMNSIELRLREELLP
jgi:probable rRNA maturation factor